MRIGPKFPTRMYSASVLPRVLIGGENNPKIGKTWEKGRGWEGARIFTLTLPERATCPACPCWDYCYGNGMPSAIRVLPDEHLIPKLKAEIPVLLAKCDRIAVRLHVLGDFYSPNYVRFWIDEVRNR